MKLNIQAFLNSLVFMGEGMLGIFAVMVIIIGVIYALGHFTAKEGRINLNGRLTPRKAKKCVCSKNDGRKRGCALAWPRFFRLLWTWTAKTGIMKANQREEREKAWENIRA